MKRVFKAMICVAVSAAFTVSAAAQEQQPAQKPDQKGAAQKGAEQKGAAQKPTQKVEPTQKPTQKATQKAVQKPTQKPTQKGEVARHGHRTRR